MSEIEVPKGWQLSKISEVGKIITGSTPNTKNSEFYGDDFPFYKPADLDSGDIISISRNGLSKEGIKHARFLQKNSILVTCIGSIGKSSMINKPGACNQQLNAITVNEEHFLPKFIFYWIKSNSFQNLMNRYANRTTLPIINKSKFKNLPVIYPDIKTQNKIIQKLDYVLGQLEEKKKEISKLQNLKHKELTSSLRVQIIHSGFQGKFTVAIKSKNDAYDFQQKLRITHKILNLESLGVIPQYSLPKKWAWFTIENLCEVVRGGSPRPAGDPRYFGGEIPWITVGSITKDNKMYLDEGEGFLTEEGKDNSRFLKYGTLLLTNSGATLGVPKIMRIDGCINDGSVALLGLPDTLKKYLYYYFLSLTEKLRTLKQGAAQPNLNTSIVKSIPVPLAPLEVQNELVKIFDQKIPYLSYINEKIKDLDQNQKLFLTNFNNFEHSILHKAFSGKLV